MRCPRCSHENRTGARFCDVCGAPLGSPSPGAERRHLAVVFADLVGSTELSHQLDPEDLREVLGAYHAAVRSAVEGYGGHIAMLLGDGVVSYFGFPHAQEHDVERAVRAGLGILEAVRALGARIEARHGRSLAVRVGIHTGEVVVRSGEGLGADIVGETPNVAARLQGLAPPNALVISAGTQRLVQGLFRVEDLGVHQLRGVSRPMGVYRVLSPSGVRSRLDAVGEDALTRFVGREEEVGLLVAKWEEARAGRGGAVVVSGEAGIGKSRLVRTFRARIADHPHTWLECAGSPYTQDSAFHPVIELHASGLGFAPDDDAERKLAKLEAALERADFSLADAVPMIARLHSIPLPARYAHARPLPGRYASIGLTPEAVRRKTKEVARDWLLRLSRQQPVVLLIEDLHWIDPSSLELVGEVLDRIGDTRTLLILTHRAAFVPPWTLPAHATLLPLDRLDASHAARLVESAAGGRPLPGEWIEEIVAKTDGVPLFLEEMTKVALEAGDGRPRLDVPATLKGLLMARLDQLGEAREAAQLGAVIGREFSFELLRVVWPHDEAELHAAIDKLAAAALLYRIGDPVHEAYAFKHALVQEAAYESLLKADRQRFHERLGDALEERFAALAERPELLAHHFTEAGRPERAIPFWYLAGQRGTERSAHVEAIRHLTRGLECTERLPPGSERDGLELGLRTLLAANLTAVKGYAAEEVLDNCARALDLCSRLEESPAIFPVLYGLWLFHLVRADRETTRDLAERLLQFAEQTGEPEMAGWAHIAAAITAYWQGEFDSARAHALETRALVTPTMRTLTTYGDDPETYSFIYDGMPQWFLGHPDEAIARLGEALALAERLGYAFTVAGVLSFYTQLFQLAGDVERTRELAERAIAHSREQNFPLWVGAGLVHRGWALLHGGDVPGGVEQIELGLATFRATGAVLNTHYFCALLAEGHLIAGNRERGLAAVEEGLALVAKHLDTYFAPELHRLEGELLLLAPGNAAAAEACHRRALELARTQRAPYHELRAALSLARLVAARGETAAARALLEETAGRAPGAAPRDREEAGRLLAALSAGG
jgi:class 3 adenylate cyclase/predicted ATPase